MTEAFTGGVPVPVGSYGGSLAHIRTDDLLGRTLVWASERVVADVRDPDRAPGPLRGRRGAGRQGGIDASVGLAVHEGRGAVHAARHALHARHHLGRRGWTSEPQRTRA
jgi:hypothetical protein